MTHIEVRNIKWDTDGEDVFLPECVVILDYHQPFKHYEMEEAIADALSDHFGFCHFGFDWSVKDTSPVNKSVVMQDARFNICNRCGSPLDHNGKCTDNQCPFDSHVQSCPCGWIGHPEHSDIDEDTKCSCP